MSTTKVIAAAKERVTTLELARKICGEGKRYGQEVYFPCPLHDDRKPSFRVNPGKDAWYCDPCGEGGDLIDLAQRAWRIENAAVAAAEVMSAFGYADEIPPRPESWFRRRERQRDVRDFYEQAKIDNLGRRIFKYLFVPWLEELPPDERETASKDASRRSRWMAERLWARKLMAEGREG